MKKFIAILFLSALPVINILSAPDPHDSLLFDGGSETYWSKSDKECEFVVTYIKGNATGTIKKKTIYESCGVKDSIFEYENGALKKYSLIKGGEHVKTGTESTVKIELSDGSVMVLGPNSDYTLPTNVCDEIRTSFLTAGSLWTKIKKLLGGGKFEVSTGICVIGNRGTEYSIEIIEENGIKYNIAKVYEGSIEVSLKDLEKKSDDSNENEIAKLNEDVQSGKVTSEEYAARLREILKNQQNGTPNPSLTRIVEAGYSLKTDGKILGELQPFNTTEETWFKIEE